MKKYEYREEIENEFNYMLETLYHDSILTNDCGIAYYWENSKDYKSGKNADYIQTEDESMYEFLVRVYEDIERINQLPYDIDVDIRDKSLNDY